MAIPLYSFPAMCERSGWFPSSPLLGTAVTFYFSRPNERELVSYGGFNLHFPSD